jgi:toluene monooxygenase system protein D
VGPVLVRGPLSAAVLRALVELNPGLTSVDRGAYLRVSTPRRCVLSRAAVERHLGGPFRLPADLEGIMPSFKGRLSLSEDEAVWEEAPVR